MHRSRFANQQRGAALLVIVVTLVIGAAALFYGLTTATPPEIEQDRITAAALATAKAALIGYATSVNNFSGTARPGDLPCPDRSDNGLAGGGHFLVLDFFFAVSSPYFMPSSLMPSGSRKNTA